MLPGPAVPGSCLVSFHILWAILSTSTVRHFVFVTPSVYLEQFGPRPTVSSNPPWERCVLLYGTMAGTCIRRTARGHSRSPLRGPRTAWFSRLGEFRRRFTQPMAHFLSSRLQLVFSRGVMRNCVKRNRRRIVEWIEMHDMTMMLMLQTFHCQWYMPRVRHNRAFMAWVVVIERERTVRSVLNGPSVLFLSQPLWNGAEHPHGKSKYSAVVNVPKVQDRWNNTTCVLAHSFMQLCKVKR